MRLQIDISPRESFLYLFWNFLKFYIHTLIIRRQEIYVPFLAIYILVILRTAQGAVLLVR